MANQYTIVVIGSGFGGTMTSLSLARKLKQRHRGESIHILERGTWWTTPVETVQDKTLKARDVLEKNKQPVQFWASADNFKGLVDLFLRCFRRPHHEDGLYDLTTFGNTSTGENDGVTVARASGVGGGSLIYANVTIEPPEFVLKDPAWPTTWTDPEREHYFALARHAIGYGVLSAREAFEKHNLPYRGLAMPPKAVNTGLSNIVTRSARLDPQFVPGTKHIDAAKSTPANNSNALWIDRARIFQTAMQALTTEYGTVDSSINDLTPENTPIGPSEPPANYPPGDHQPKNYCERQGRCILGCLPGARHTLNKQLMKALYTGTGEELLNDVLSLEALAIVDELRAQPGGGYEIRYHTRDKDDPGKKTPHVITADKVIVAAGCIGTNEVLLRSQSTGGLPHLSDRVGVGFSTNGDYLAFLEQTTERVNLSRGPITTSYGHFNTQAPQTGLFHTIEDNGIPKALALLVGKGVHVLNSLAKNGRASPALVAVVIGQLIKKLWEDALAFLAKRVPPGTFEADELLTTNMMCIAAMGRDQARGKFRLGDQTQKETALRVARTDGIAFHEDPIYKELKPTLDRFAAKLTTSGELFHNPFLEVENPTIGISHPLGGCGMGKDHAAGVCDEFGRVFNAAQTGSTRPFYDGLYLADAAIIPTALGVNPSLTISALALRVADNIVAELPP